MVLSYQTNEVAEVISFLSGVTAPLDQPAIAKKEAGSSIEKDKREPTRVSIVQLETSMKFFNSVQ